MISEHVAAQAHFEESKGNRHNTTGLALPTTSHFDVFSRMEQRDERYMSSQHPYAAASEVPRETELGDKKTKKMCP